MTKRNYEKRMSKKGGIQDQMNCLLAYMEGYGYRLDGTDPSQEKVRSIRYNYRYNNTQWQIGQIEYLSDQIGMSYTDMFQLSEYLYCYCPSFNSTSQDYDRLRRLGASVKAMGLDATRAQDIGKLQLIQDQLDALKDQVKGMGLELKVELI